MTNVQALAAVAESGNEDHYCRICQQTVSISLHFITSEAGQLGTSEIGRDELIHVTIGVNRDDPRQYHICHQLDFLLKRVLVREFHMKSLEERNPTF